MIRPLLRNDDEVRVRDPISMNQIANPFKREDFAHAAADLLCNRHDTSCYRIGNVGKMVDVLVRNDQALAWSSRLQCHERRDDVVTIDEACGLSSGNYLAKNAAHRGVVVKVFVLTLSGETFHR